MPAETPYKGLIVAVCHECHPLRVIDDQCNCGCDPKPAVRRATLCPRRDWASSCPNPGDPGELSARHGVQFELAVPPLEAQPEPITWKPGPYPEQSAAWCGRQLWAAMTKQHSNSPFLEQINGSRYRVELTPPPKVLEGLTEQEATAIAEAYTNLMDDIFANR